MKRSVILLVALLTVVSGAYAQRDDMYYRPSKKDKVDKAANTSEKAANSNTINYSTTYDDYDGYTDDEIDAYTVVMTCMGILSIWATEKATASRRMTENMNRSIIIMTTNALPA